MGAPERFASPDACAEALIERLGGRLRVAVPLGLGKPVRLLNALYRQASRRPEIELHIFTALTLEIPRPSSALEARLLTGVVDRLYAGVPELDYARDRSRGALPANVAVTEFYFRPGSALGLAGAQQRYISSNYTHAARDVAARGINLLAQMVAPGAGSDPDRYSLSCNPDLTRDLLDAVREQGREPPLVVGEANPRLPFMPGSAEIAADELALLLEGEAVDYGLFPVPARPVGLAEHAIGIRVAALIRDGGTLQVGIGSLGDAVVHALGLRRRHNGTFRALVAALGGTAPEPELDDLPRGLYAASEMFVEGFLHLREQGVLRRTVDDGIFLHAGFFLGSARFYERLRRLPDAERRGIDMTRISFTNSVLNGEADKRAHRVDARFVNTAMMATLLGAVVSDGLEDGRVVSGVGGQYDFVAMAHQLAGARSIIALPATRTSGGRVSSNVVWHYGHTTIPRHLRDVVVTEYGVADLRGASDQDVIAAMLNLADSRFQEDLRRRAVAAGKLPKAYRIPERFRNNRPETLARQVTAADAAGDLPWFPLGTDFTAEEAALAVALTGLAERQGGRLTLLMRALAGRRLAGRGDLAPALGRMGLTRPRGLRERFHRALVADALVRHVHDGSRPLLPGSPHEAQSDPQADR